MPPTWTEEQERALVADIGAELPAGIRLEYEGRYRAMFSHEVKNYALLTYDGRLVVHGVALRSSRAEPFGGRFLRQALISAMTGNVPSLRQSYLETVAALRARALSAADVAARVRLSKSPEAYLASRVGHPEPQYEALLASGRNRWSPGERVRFYRARGGSYVWLPEEADEAPAGNSWEEVEPDETEDEVLPVGQISANSAPDGNGQGTPSRRAVLADRRDYEVEHYLRVLVTSYAARLRKAFEPDDFEQLFRPDGQAGLFDRPVETIQPRWIRCQRAD